jgi:hypothetical protein
MACALQVFHEQKASQWDSHSQTLTHVNIEAVTSPFGSTALDVSCCAEAIRAKYMIFTISALVDPWNMNFENISEGQCQCFSMLLWGRLPLIDPLKSLFNKRQITTLLSWFETEKPSAVHIFLHAHNRWWSQSNFALVIVLLLSDEHTSPNAISPDLPVQHNMWPVSMSPKSYSQLERMDDHLTLARMNEMPYSATNLYSWNLEYSL